MVDGVGLEVDSGTQSGVVGSCRGGRCQAGREEDVPPRGEREDPLPVPNPVVIAGMTT